MTKAEKAAQKAIPHPYSHTFKYTERDGFIKGYKQAEKDLKLTWEDIKVINQMLSAVKDEDSDDENFELSEKQFYKEVLKRFNKWKRGHSDKN